MKRVNSYRKPISMFVMMAFTVLLCFWANPSPAAPVSGRDSAAALENAESEGTSFVEQEAEPAAIKKGKKFPWLVIGAAVVIGAAAVYFLVLKKPKYTLTVSLSGATGIPATTEKYKKDMAVAYSYTAQTGYVNLQVKLDGVDVPASGTVTMDKDHTLTVTAVQGAAISVSSTPSGAKIYMNSSDSGFTTPHTFQYTTAVTRTVLVRLCGYGDHNQTVTANLGQTVTVNPTLLQGILDNFVVPSTCWNPYTGSGSTWTLSGGIYKCVADVDAWGHAYYNTIFSSSTYTAEVKMKRVKGSIFNSNSILLATNTSMNAVNGYLFNYTADGWFSVWEYTNQNLITGIGTAKPIEGWQATTRVVQDLGSWNTLKVVRSGSNYTLYINNHEVCSFIDTTYDPRVLVMAFYSGGSETELQFDYAKLELGAALGLMPAKTSRLIVDPNQKPSGRL